MAGESLLFHIDTIVVDGRPIAFEDGSATLSGAQRFDNETVPSATGKDFAKRRRVPTTLRARLQFNNQVDPAQLGAQRNVQITARDTQSGRRAMMQDCMFGTLGDLGGGAVDVTYLVLSEVQWL
jgi:hypothetical protein